MADKTLSISITGDEQIIEPALAAFCFQGGYRDDVYVLNEEGDSEVVPNPVTMLDFAKQRLSEFFRNEVAQYNVAQAQKQAADTAQAQTLGAMDLVTMNVTIN